LPLARRLPSHIPVYGLQGDAETACNRAFDQIAADYVKEIRTFQPRGPYFIAGYSIGGVVAHEMARQLSEHSGHVRLFLVDSYPRNLPAPWRWLMQIRSAAIRSRQLIGPVAKRPLAALRHPEIVVALGRALLRGSSRLTRTVLSVPNSFDESMARFVPSPYSGDATLFLAARSGLPLEFGWKYLMRNPIDVQPLPSTHATIFGEGLGGLATALADRYDRYSQNSNNGTNGSGR
jgi:acetoacetyl-CoA synthetase